MQNVVLTSPPAGRALRPRYRPPLGLPLRRPGRWGEVWSLLTHALVIFLILVPLFEHDVLLVAQKGAGGAGPAGGGGGGLRGTGADRMEKVRFFAMPTPPPPAPAPPPVAFVPPAPPKIAPPPEPPPVVAPPRVTAPEVVPAPVEAAVVVGAGGGTGADGTAGTGPGTGGGVGTGVGTGHGSANGPGTGGEGGEIYGASPDYTILPPYPVPSSVKGKLIRIQFSLDERGKVLELVITETGNRSFDRAMRERMMRYKFRPAHKADGTPVATVFQVEWQL